jgi:hypothetical protein
MTLINVGPIDMSSAGDSATPMRTPDIALDGTCGHPSHQRDETYLMEASCLNCDSVALIRLTKGHQHPGYSGGPAFVSGEAGSWA